MEINTSTRVLALITFVVYSVVCIVLGAYKKKGTKESFGKSYFSAGGNLGGLTNGLLLAAGLCSGGMFLSNPGLAHSWGLYWVVCMGTYAFTGLLCNSVVNTKLKVVCGRINAVSFGSALQHRYNNNQIIAWYTPLAIILFTGLFLYQQITSGAKLMESLTGLPYIWGLIIFGVVILLYTLLGGGKGASRVAVFQGAIMTITTIALTIGVVSAVRGEFGTVQSAFENLAATSPSVVSPVATFSFFVLASMLFQVGFSSCIGKDSVAQAIKVKDGKSMHDSTILSMILCMLWGIVMPLIGTLGRTIFPDITSDTVVPYTALATLPGVFAGIVGAGVTAAIHSTVTFHLLNINSSIVMDIYQNLIKKGNVEDSKLKRVNTIAMVIVVICMVAFAIKPPALIGIINIFSIGGGAAAFFLPLLFGLWWDRANEWGALASMVGGIGYYFLATYVKSFAFGFNALIPALVFGTIMMVVVSLLTPAPKYDILDVWFGVGETVHREERDR